MVAGRALILGGIAIIGAMAFVLTRVTRAPTKVAPPTVVRSVAVIPVVDSGDTANQRLAGGIASEISRSLRSVYGVRVVAAPMPSDARANRLGELLNVGALVLLQLAHDPAPRLGVRLRSGDGTTLLDRSYDASSAELLAAEDAIATDVANALRADLALPSIRKIVVAGSRDPLAHELFLKARYDSAVRVDPLYAHAWASLADEQAQRGDPGAAAAAQRALAIDSTLAGPHVVLGKLQRQKGQVERAEDEYLKALRLDPQLASARYEYSLLLADRGRTDEALRESRRAHELDPLSLELHANYSRMLLLAGRTSESVHEDAERRRIADVLRPTKPVARANARTKHAKQTSRGGSRRQHK